MGRLMLASKRKSPWPRSWRQALRREERPLLLIVANGFERGEILAFLAEQIVKWWIPDEVIFLDYLPGGGTGKVQKRLFASATAAIYLGGE